MSLITWVVVGALTGWLASMLAVNSGRQGMGLSIVIGAIGASLGGRFLSPLVDVNLASQDDFSIWTVGVAVVGAVALIGLIDLAQRMSAR